jgi:hypothetical protein
MCVSSVYCGCSIACRRIVDIGKRPVPRFCSTIPTAAAMIAFLTAGKTLTYPPSGALVVDVRRMYRRTYRENTCKENDGSHFTCVNKKQENTALTRCEVRRARWAGSRSSSARRPGSAVDRTDTIGHPHHVGADVPEPAQSESLAVKRFLLAFIVRFNWSA